jgi:hypothetical protein
MPWESWWLAAMAVINTAQKVFTPGARPPGELMPLVEPVHRLGNALRAKDDAQIKLRAVELVANSEIIEWACRADQPEEIREFGVTVAYLARTLET